MSRVPVLAERGIPAVAFAVAGRMGGTNAWASSGAGVLDLLDADGLRAIAGRGVEIGSHGASHRPLPSVPPDELEEELAGSAARLEAIGVPRPGSSRTPMGKRARSSARRFATPATRPRSPSTTGFVQRGVDRYALPRIEVLASDTPRKLRLKIATARWPERPRRRVLRRLRVRVLVVTDGGSPHGARAHP